MIYADTDEIKVENELEQIDYEKYYDLKRLEDQLSKGATTLITKERRTQAAIKMMNTKYGRLKLIEK